MSRSTAPRFLFDTDFRAPPKVDAPVVDEPPPIPTIPLSDHHAALAAAEAAAFARGEAAGRVAAQEFDERRIADALERLAGLLVQQAAREEAVAAAQEAAAVDLALAFARKLAGAAIARFPLAAIEAAAHECFAEARQAPHVVVRVHEHFVDVVKKRLSAIAAERGFAGKLVVLGDPEIAPADVRLDWADGGIIRDRDHIADAVNTAVQNFLAAEEAARQGTPS